MVDTRVDKNVKYIVLKSFILLKGQKYHYELQKHCNPCNERKFHCVKRLFGMSNQNGGKVELRQQRN